MARQFKKDLVILRLAGGVVRAVPDVRCGCDFVWLMVVLCWQSRDSCEMAVFSCRCVLDSAIYVFRGVLRECCSRRLRPSVGRLGRPCSSFPFPWLSHALSEFQGTLVWFSRSVAVGLWGLSKWEVVRIGSGAPPSAGFPFGCHF